MRMPTIVLGLAKGDSPSHLIIGRLGATLLAFATAPVVAHAIGPTGRGETAAAIALFNLVPIFLGLGVPLEVRRQAALGTGPAALRSARVFNILALALSVPLAAVAYLTLFAAFDGSTRWAASTGVALAPLMMNWTCDLSLLIAAGRFRGVMALQLVQPGMYLVFVMLLLSLGQLNTSTVLVANIGGTSAAFILGSSLTRIPMRGARVPLPKTLRGGARFAGSSMAEAASSRLDQVLALPLIGAAQAGLYAVAVTIATIPMAVGQALGATYFRRIARSEPAQLASVREEAVRVSLSAGLVSFPMTVVASWIGVPLLFGEAFEPAVPVAWIVAGGTTFGIVAFVASMCLAAAGRGYTMTVAQLTALALGTGLLFIVGPAFGAQGAAAASATASLALSLFLVAALRIRPVRGLPSLRDFQLLAQRLMRSDK